MMEHSCPPAARDSDGGSSGDQAASLPLFRKPALVRSRGRERERSLVLGSCCRGSAVSPLLPRSLPHPPPLLSLTHTLAQSSLDSHSLPLTHSLTRSPTREHTCRVTGQVALSPPVARKERRKEGRLQPTREPAYSPYTQMIERRSSKRSRE